MDHASVSAGGAYTLAAQEDQFDPGTPADFRFKVLGPGGQAVTDYRPTARPRPSPDCGAA
jgi:hypothetical protein